jgi:hypothetical protein
MHLLTLKLERLYEHCGTVSQLWLLVQGSRYGGGKESEVSALRNAFSHPGNEYRAASVSGEPAA